jgi:tetratricopeptide (TPR) repeat protein
LLPTEQKRELLEEVKGIERTQACGHMHVHRLAATAILAAEEGRFADSCALLSSVVDLARAAGRNRQCANLLMWLAFVCEDAGALDAAVDHCREAVALFRASGAANLLRGLRSLVSALLDVGDSAEARLALVELIDLSRRCSWEDFLPMPGLFAMFAALEGRFEAAAKLLGLSERLFPPGQNWGKWGKVMHDRIRALLTGALAPATLQSLLAQGAALDEQGACALALERLQP